MILFYVKVVTNNFTFMYLFNLYVNFFENYIVGNNLIHFGLKNCYGIISDPIISREDNSENEEISRIVIH